MTKKDLVKIFDTTLRDGEQCPGATMTLPEKLRVAKQLERLNVDIIEAGFPIASKEDFESVKAIAGVITEDVEVAGLARCLTKDIDAAYKAVKDARKPRIHVFLATSDIHLKYKLKITKAQALKQVKEMVAYAYSLCKNIEFSAEDASRSDKAFLAEVVETAIQQGATTINIPDTVGYSTPEEFAAYFQYLQKHVPSFKKACFSTHCHDDLGLATANSFAGVRNGARQVECAVNGLGERAGNCSLEEIVMAIKTHSAAFNIDTRINTKEIMPASRLVSKITSFPVAPNKAIVGYNAFRHEAGIHQHGLLANKATYEIMSAEDIGLQSDDLESGLVLGKHSGRHAFSFRLKQLGFNLSDDEITKCMERFKDVADKKKHVYDEDLIAIVKTAADLDAQPMYKMEYFSVTSGDRQIATATIKVKRGKKSVLKSAIGNGPVAAIFSAIEAATRFKFQLKDYTIRSCSVGREAMGEVMVQIEQDGKSAVGIGASTDILEASALALLNAINRLVINKAAKRLKAQG
jgi:2-isopropylmalate synthase